MHDKGQWTVSEDGTSIESDDLTNDVILRVTGDFCCDEQRKAYADNLAKKLNASNAEFESMSDTITKLKIEIEVQSYWGAKWEAEYAEVTRLRQILQDNGIIKDE